MGSFDGIQLPEPYRDTTRKIIHIDMDAFFQRWKSATTLRL
ncbi:DNA polymerase IV [Bacillus sp. JCM 19046]|nr:DNA polymerase IV [Bacillus sp. JCM 19045]GAF16657.1 DNA polymerase IV [Bacillus sp. JCM 19046]